MTHYNNLNRLIRDWRTEYNNIPDEAELRVTHKISRNEMSRHGNVRKYKIQENNDILLNAIEEHLQNNLKYFNNQLLSDCVLKVGTKTFYAHKLILAKSSDVFQTLFYTKHWSKTSRSNDDLNDDDMNGGGGAGENVIDQHVLVETEECAEVFEKFLRFFYTADILISNDEVIGLLYLSDKYNVVSLRNVVLEFMTIRAKSPNIKNAIDWYRIAKDFKLVELKEVCLETTSWNMEYLINSDEWLYVDLDFIKDLLTLKSNDLILPSEYLLYSALSKWLLYENEIRRKENFKNNCIELIPLIRFSQMLDTDLYEIEKSELAENYLSADIIKQQLYKAYRFRVLEHLLLKTSSNLENSNNTSRNSTEFDTNLTEFDKSNDIEFYDAWYLPRDYVELNLVDIVEIKNTLRVGIQVDVKTYKGIAPKKEKNLEWKVLYRLSDSDSQHWKLRITCNPLFNDSSKKIRAKASIIVYNNEHVVIQVEQGRTFTFNNGSYYDIDLQLNDPNESKEMYLLIKPILF